MSTPTSALGSSLGGAADLIGAVGNLLPTTTTASGHTTSKASANSNTLSGELNVGQNTTIGSEKTSNSSVNQSNMTGGATETGTHKSTTSSSGVSNEAFSGQSNATTTQTMLTDEGVMRIVNMMLQGTGGIPGLQETVSGERNAGMFNSSTNSLLSTNLVSTIAGEVARLSAPTVQTQNLGATNTQTTSNTSTLVDAITSALTSMNQNTSGSQSGTSETSTQQDVLNLVLGLAQQFTDQSSESETNNSSKTKTKKFPSYICTWMESTLKSDRGREDFEALGEFKIRYLIPYQPRLLLGYDIIGPMIVNKLEQLTGEVQLEEALRIREQFIIPAAEKYWQEDNFGALRIYTEMVLSLHDKYIRGV